MSADLFDFLSECDYLIKVSQNGLQVTFFRSVESVDDQGNTETEERPDAVVFTDYVAWMDWIGEKTKAAFSDLNDVERVLRRELEG